jgi:hypothetical protein
VIEVVSRSAGEDLRAIKWCWAKGRAFARPVRWRIHTQAYERTMPAFEAQVHISNIQLMYWGITGEKHDGPSCDPPSQKRGAL